MDLRIINYFIALYEERSFTKAAERVHVVQPALSMQIRNLEAELGAQLFERSSRGVEPTAAGRRFYELSVPIAHNIATLKQEVVDLVRGDLVSGALRVGLPPSVCLGVGGAVLARFSEQHPNVDVTLVEAYSRDLTEMVQDGDADAVLGAMPGGRSSLACRPTFSDRFVLVSGRPLLGERFTPCDLFALENLKLVIPPGRHLIGNTVLDLVMTGKLRPKKVTQIDGLIATLEFVRHSDWSALCPVVSVVNELVDGRLYINPITDPVLPFELYQVHDPRRPLTMAARRFFEILQAELERVRQLRAQVLKI